MKKCRNPELDPTLQFFNAAGSLYSVDDNVENVDNFEIPYFLNGKFQEIFSNT